MQNKTAVDTHLVKWLCHLPCNAPARGSATTHTDISKHPSLARLDTLHGMKISQAVTTSVLFVALAITHAAHSDEQAPLTIGLIGDSTVASTYGWGPAFADRFAKGTTVLNFAKNGATLESLSRKLDELLQQKPDYVLIQFGHNDQKRYGPDVYSKNLTSYIERVIAAGAKPIVLSSVTRRNFGDDGKIAFRENGLHGNLSLFAKAAGEVAKEHNVPFLDLHTISVAHHNKLGPEATAAYNFNGDDRTHFSPAGAKATADLVINALLAILPNLEPRLKSSDEPKT